MRNRPWPQERKRSVSRKPLSTKLGRCKNLISRLTWLESHPTRQHRQPYDYGSLSRPSLRPPRFRNSFWILSLRVLSDTSDLKLIFVMKRGKYRASIVTPPLTSNFSAEDKGSGGSRLFCTLREVLSYWLKIYFYNVIQRVKVFRYLFI